MDPIRKTGKTPQPAAVPEKTKAAKAETPKELHHVIDTAYTKVTPTFWSTPHAPSVKKHSVATKVPDRKTNAKIPAILSKNPLGAGNHNISIGTDLPNAKVIHRSEAIFKKNVRKK